MTAPAVSPPPTASRWLILGPGGAGKSTFSLELGRILELPVVHLDRHFWRPGWTAPSGEEWRRQVGDLVRGDAWILDGNYSSTLDLRLRRAQAAVLLDPPVLRCLWGVIGRSTWRRGRGRPDLPDGCEEQFPELQFLHYVATYRWRSMPKVLRQIDEANHIFFRHLRNRREATAFLGELKRGRA